jgi:hypothetical protein
MTLYAQVPLIPLALFPDPKGGFMTDRFPDDEALKTMPTKKLTRLVQDLGFERMASEQIVAFVREVRDRQEKQRLAMIKLDLARQVEDLDERQYIIRQAELLCEIHGLP